MKKTITYAYRIQFSSEEENVPLNVELSHSQCISRVLKLAQLEANPGTGINSIDLIVNLLEEKGSIASRLLGKWIKNTDILKSAKETLTGDFPASVAFSNSNVQPSQSLRGLVEEAQIIAGSYDQVFNTAHLLLAITKSESNIAKTLLIIAGVPIDELKSEVIDILKTNSINVALEE